MALRLGPPPVCLAASGLRGGRETGRSSGSVGAISHGRSRMALDLDLGGRCSLVFCECSSGARPSETIGPFRNRRSGSARKKRPLSRVFCAEPTGQELNQESPWLQWAVLAALIAAGGVAVFLKVRGGKLVNVGAAGGAVTLQADPRSMPMEGPAKFSVNLPWLGTLTLGHVTPGWVYFLLLMAAGFGLFVSEEALNVWVGASLGRLLSYGSRETFLTSLTTNWPYIVTTILWVYCGVCVSDMVPFFAGKLASRESEGLSQKIGVSKEKYEQVTGRIQRYGNLIGVVERFSVGVRNPTAFLAGVAGVSPERFFAGVCVGALLTLPIQLGVGFAVRERPLAALAGVATVVGAWTIFPYAFAGMASIYYLLRRRTGKTSP